MKMFRIAVAMFVAVLMIRGMTASAQAPLGDSPSNAISINNQLRNIPANQGLWFRFDYDATERPEVTIQLINNTQSRMRFEVWTPDAVADMANNHPIGYGAAFTVVCPVNAPSPTGCQTKNLIFTGAFGDTGTYRVLVINDTNLGGTALLTIEGIELAAESAIAPSPARNSNPVIQNTDDPGRASNIDNAQHPLAASAAVWYRFDYDASDRPRKTVLLVNGNHSGVRFEVWTPDRLNNWWENKPVGRGTVHLVDCDTGEESEMGECEAPYLKWAGRFVISWPVYVRVVNGNGHSTSFTLTLQ